MMRPVLIAMTALFSSTIAVAAAGDFDGTKKIICASVIAMDCSAGEDCVKGMPKDIGAPAFLRVDFANKVINGPQRDTDIRVFEKMDDHLLLQGTELGYAWSMAVGRTDGEMSLSLVDSHGVFVLFGSCTAL